MSASTNWEDVYRTQTARIAELERENAALRKELDWKTERLKLLSNCLHNIDDLVKQAAASIFLDAIGATLKEAQP